MKANLEPPKFDMNVDKVVLERMMKDMDTEDVYVQSRKDGKVFRCKSGYAKQLIKLDKARFVITVEEAKKKGITVDHHKELQEFANNNKTIIIR